VVVGWTAVVVGEDVVEVGPGSGTVVVTAASDPVQAEATPSTITPSHIDPVRVDRIRLRSPGSATATYRTITPKGTAKPRSAKDSGRQASIGPFSPTIAG